MLNIKTIKTVNFVDALRELQRNECEDVDMDLPGSGVAFKLPDGREPIHDRLWHKLASEPQHGNQTFTNDSLFRVHLGNEHGEGLEEDMQKLADICQHAIHEDVVVFDVCW